MLTSTSQPSLIVTPARSQSVNRETRRGREGPRGSTRPCAWQGESLAGLAMRLSYPVHCWLASTRPKATGPVMPAGGGLPVLCAGRLDGGKPKPGLS
jgi:hypothetical protein